MRQRYHTIFRPMGNQMYVGWVEEVPGTLTYGHSLVECRENLRQSLQLMLSAHRDEARLGMDDSCIQDSIEVDVGDSDSEIHPHFAHA